MMKNVPEHILSGISIILSLISCLLLFVIADPFLVIGTVSLIMCIIDLYKTRKWCVLNIIGINIGDANIDNIDGYLR